MQHEHEKSEAKANKHRRTKTPFKIGQWVWVLRTRTAETNLESWWTGPCRIVSRCGTHSYVVDQFEGRRQEVHRDWLKPYIED